METLEKKKIMNDEQIAKIRKEAQELIADLESRDLNKRGQVFLAMFKQNLEEFDGTEHFGGTDSSTYEEVFNLGE